MQNLQKWIVENEGQTRLIGICFGHQIIAKAFGANVMVNPRGYECGVVEIVLSEGDTKLLQTSKPSMYLTASHFDIVESVPPGFISVGKSSLCDIQGLYKPGIITTQCHPELPAEFWRDLIEFRGSEMSEESKARMQIGLDNPAEELDRHWFASRLLEFARGNFPGNSGS